MNNLETTSDCPICGTDDFGRAVLCPHPPSDIEEFDSIAALMESNTSWAQY